MVFNSQGHERVGRSTDLWEKQPCQGCHRVGCRPVLGTGMSRGGCGNTPRHGSAARSSPSAEHQLGCAQKGPSAPPRGAWELDVLCYLKVSPCPAGRCLCSSSRRSRPVWGLSKHRRHPVPRGQHTSACSGLPKGRFGLQLSQKCFAEANHVQKPRAPPLQPPRSSSCKRHRHRTGTTLHHLQHAPCRDSLSLLDTSTVQSQLNIKNERSALLQALEVILRAW